MILGGRLEGERIAVRPFEGDDADALVALLGDPAVHRFVGEGTPLSPEDASLWVSRSRQNLARFGYGTGAVELRDGGGLIGWAGFARPGDGSEELIYGFARQHWRQGYGRELLALLIGFASARRIDPLRATVHPDNVASIGLLKQTGFHLSAKNQGGAEDSHLYVRTASPTPGPPISREE
ncbi:GNAT family N-acetyltransferase [Mangrovicella endophytica]|uniref:GNAT family N-acetyltransferase n=1 Tax=Mangrovicella endophytica TaxID=2066697 RepID=UPI000C9DC8E8|nr:GNAT family N-acetyltransferase [Mangrovicella endophytica]